MNCLRQQAAVTANDEPMILLGSLGQSPEVREEADSSGYPSLEWPLGARRFRCQGLPNGLHELVDLPGGQLRIERLEHVSNEWNVGAGQKRFCSCLQFI